MSNLGLEITLAQIGIPFRRAKVGDRNVLAMLKDQGGVIGGETSGHILCLDRATTGDALVSALQVLEVMKDTGRSLAQLGTDMSRFPQVLLNVPVARRYDPGTVPSIREVVARVEQRLAGEGRVVLRPSGTEPVIRVMVEGRDERETQDCAELIAEAVRAAGNGAAGTGKG
jgi:phosphoglucosamine mutase